MDRINTIETIEELQNNGKCFYIDILPETIENERYFELEEFMLKMYLKKFSEKMGRIIVKIITYYDSEIYIADLPEGYKGKLSSFLPWTDIRSESLEKIYETIIDVIDEAVTSMEILVKGSLQFLISINGEFSVEIYGLPSDDYALIRELIEQEGLYFKEYSEE